MSNRVFLEINFLLSHWQIHKYSIYRPPRILMNRHLRQKPLRFTLQALNYAHKQEAKKKFQAPFQYSVKFSSDCSLPNAWRTIVLFSTLVTDQDKNQKV